MNPKPAPAICPQCGTPLSPRAAACPECGSDWQTGWSTRADVDWESPDYDELLEKEFGGKPPTPPLGKVKVALAAALALLLGLLWAGVF